MGLFEKLEARLDQSAHFASEALERAKEASAGWGKTVDNWLEDAVSLDSVRDATIPVEARVDDFLEVVANRINAYLDGKYYPSDSNSESEDRSDVDFEAVFGDDKLADAFLQEEGVAEAVAADVESDVPIALITTLVKERKFGELVGVISPLVESISEESDENIRDARIADLRKAGVKVGRNYQGKYTWQIVE